MDPAAETEALINSHLPWVYRTVGDLVARIPRHVDRDDLTSAGLLALVLSAHAFEQSRGVPFMRFAAARLQGALLDELRALDGASRSARQLVRRVNTGREELGALLGRTPTTTELGRYLGLSVREMDRALHEVRQASSLHWEEFTADTVANLLRDQAPGPEDIVLHEARIRNVREAVERLPARLRRIVIGYFLHGRPMTELASELSISRPRVSQLCAQALEKLRADLRDHFDCRPDTDYFTRTVPAPRRNCDPPFRSTISQSGRPRPASARTAIADDRVRPSAAQG
jgi:RNA polymerase sigma factor for flagellar operon FliA